MRSTAAHQLLNAPDPVSGEVTAPHRQLTDAVVRALRVQPATRNRRSIEAVAA
jgi:hypothetical protein